MASPSSVSSGGPFSTLFYLMILSGVGVMMALPEPEAGLPMTSSLIRLRRQAKGGACTTSADCIEPNVCSKWGWCQWTKIYGNQVMH